MCMRGHLFASIARDDKGDKNYSCTEAFRLNEMTALSSASLSMRACAWCYRPDLLCLDASILRLLACGKIRSMFSRNRDILRGCPWMPEEPYISSALQTAISGIGTIDALNEEMLHDSLCPYRGAVSGRYVIEIR